MNEVGAILMHGHSGQVPGAPIFVRAKLRIFATPMLEDRQTYANRNSAYLITWELRTFPT